MSFKIHKVLTLPEIGSAGDWYLLKTDTSFDIYVAQTDGVLVKNSNLTEEQIQKISDLPTASDLSVMLDGKVNKMIQFLDITTVGQAVDIDYLKTPYASVTLDNFAVNTFTLNILNMDDGQEGKLMVYQAGEKRLELGTSLIGQVELPVSTGAVILCEYQKVAGQIYITSKIVKGNFNIVPVSEITTLTYGYYDNSLVTLNWLAPWSQHENEAVTYYDIRYANSEVNAADSAVWSTMAVVDTDMVPRNPSVKEDFTLTGLLPDKDYYIYIRGVRVIKGTYSYGRPSAPVHVRTRGSSNLGDRPYNIPINSSGLYPQLFAYRNMGVSDGSLTPDLTRVENIVDEQHLTKYLSTGYVDKGNSLSSSYKTYWMTNKYSRDTAPFYIDVDLYQIYELSKIYLVGSTKLDLNIYASTGFGSAWTPIGTMTTSHGGWGEVDFLGGSYRMIRIAFDKMDFASSETAYETGDYVFPSVQYGSTIENICNMVILGKPGKRPDKIHEPLRRTTKKRSVDEFFCVNGHAYQPGRIHALAGGSHMRMYVHSGQFGYVGPNSTALEKPTTINQLTFRTNTIPWIRDNAGGNDITNFTDLLTDTYKRYGVKPFITSTGVFDLCQYKGPGSAPYKDASKAAHNRVVDNYWLPNAPTALPKKGYGGLTNFYAITKNPQNYKTYAKLAEALSARYGDNKEAKSLAQSWEDQSVGLDLISGIEVENEPDANWNDWIGYESAEEFAAVLSATTDGHGGTMYQEDGQPLKGVKTSNILSISSGTAGINKGYHFGAMHWWKTNRPDGKVPVDAISVHTYFSNAGNQGSDSSIPVKYGVTFESSDAGKRGESMFELVKLRDRVSPNTEVWLTEFGFGEAGGNNTLSNYQCYSQAGRLVNGWTIPDRHRSEVKGAWTVRATMQLMAGGYDLANYYSTECESDYFDIGQYGQGPGYEMWDWYKLTNMAPGAKYDAIQSSMHNQNRGGFSAMGLYGNILTNGAFPITNAYWWTATMRSTLKGFVYAGKIAIPNQPKIEVIVFINATTNKSAYVVYYNDSINTGVPNVSIPLPSGVTEVVNTSVYIPKLADPRTVPANLGNDERRTGLPSSNRYRYTNGEWVNINRPYKWGTQYGTYTTQTPTFPANPVEGQEYAMIPSTAENPYFPIVGPVMGKTTPNGQKVSAQMYEIQTDGIWSNGYMQSLAWRQVDAVLDYIQYHPEGIKGTTGTKRTLLRSNDSIVVNVSEFPEFYVFDGIATPDFTSKPTEVTATTVNSTTIDLWWNNSSVVDDGYEIFSSSVPDGNYSILTTIPLAEKNTYRIENLSPGTTYYFKLRATKGTQRGELSEATSATTFMVLNGVTNLRAENNTTTTIGLKWDYNASQSPDFLYYSIERAHSLSSFTEIAKIENINTLSYTDAGLTISNAYQYRIKVIGLTGLSNYSNTLVTKTLSPDEMPPAVKSLVTDKLGTKITVSFDIDVTLMNEDHSFIVEVTDKTSTVPIEYDELKIDNLDARLLQIRFNREALPAYNANKSITVRYVGNNLVSASNSTPFVDVATKQVANNTYNFTGITNVIKLNFKNSDTTANTTNTSWNNISAVKATEGTLVGTVSYSNLTNTENIATTIGVKNVNDTGTADSTKKWGNYNTSGLTSIPTSEVPAEVAKQGWSFAYNADLNGRYMSRLTFFNLDKSKIYSFSAYGGFSDTHATQKRPARMKIGDVETETIETATNRTAYWNISNVNPDANGEIHVDFKTMYPPSTNSTTYPGVNWMTIQEIENPTDAQNREVLLRGVTINNVNSKGEVTKVTSKVSINAIGTFTKYKISESSDLSAVSWINVDDGASIFDYTFLDPSATSATLYVQIGNNNNDSVIMTKTFQLALTFGLNDVVVNIDTGKPFSLKRNIKSGLVYGGDATHYVVLEGSTDFASATWLPIPSTNSIDVLLSDSYGVKTLNYKVRSGAGVESATIVKKIELLSDLNEKFYFDFQTPASVVNNKITSRELLEGGLPSGIFCNELSIYGNNTSSDYGSHQLYNYLNEPTDLYVHYNLSKYPLNTGTGFKVAYSDFSINTGAAIPSNMLAAFPYPLNLIPSNIYQKGPISKDHRSRLSLSLGAGTYRFSFIACYPHADYALPGWVNTTAYFDLIDTNTNTSLMKVPYSTNTSFRAVDNKDFNTHVDLILTERKDVTLAIYSSGSDSAPPFNGMVITRNYVEVERLLLDAMYINEGAELTFSSTVKITNRYSGTPTHYRIAETENELLVGEWLPWAGVVDFTFESDTTGPKEVYYQIKNQYESSVIRKGSIKLMSGDVVKTVNIDVLGEGLDISTIGLEFPKMKFDKKFPFSYITDDSYSIFQFIFSGIHKRYIAPYTSNFFHLGMNSSTTGFTGGKIPDYPLQFTDGTGKLRRFATSVSAWPEKLIDTSRGIGADMIATWPWMSEKEYKLYKDSGFTMMYHDLIGYDDATVTQDLFNTYFQNTKQGFINAVGEAPISLAEPNGQHKYLQLIKPIDEIRYSTAQSGDTLIKNAYPYNSDFTFNKNDISIQRYFALDDTTNYSNQIFNILNSFDAATTTSSIYWLIGSAHRSNQWEYDLFKRLNDAFGSRGSDNMWFASMDEIYEYWYLTKNNKVVKTAIPGGVRFTISFPKEDAFHFNETSQLITGIPSALLSGVTVESDTLGLSYGARNGKLLVNTNFTADLLERAERNVAAYEAAPADLDKLDYASYIVEYLKPSLAAPFVARLNAPLSAITLTHLNINGGSATGISKTVTLNITTTGGLATEFRFAETEAGLATATWKTVGDTKYEFASFGDKVLYAQARNPNHVSNIVSATIKLIQTDATVLLGFNNSTGNTVATINTNDGLVTSQINVTSNITYGSKTLIRTDGVADDTFKYNFNSAFYDANVNFVASRRINNSNTYDSLPFGKWGDSATRATFINVNANNTGIDRRGRLSVSLGVGDYRMRFLTRYPEGISNAAGSLSSGTYAVFAGATELARTNSAPEGLNPYTNEDFNASLEFTVTDAAVPIDIGIWNDTYHNKPVTNLIEILKYAPLLSVPTISTFTLNNNTNTSAVTIPVALFSDGRTSHYRISESSDLSSVAWVPYVQNFNFTLSSGLGVKTVYVQTKNALGASTVTSKTISLINPNLVISSVSSTDTTAANATISMVYNTSPTHYRTASTSEELATKEWSALVGNTGLFARPGFGTQTYYVQVKDSVDGRESNVMTGSVMFIDPDGVTVTSFMVSSTNSGGKVPVGNTTLHYTTSKTPTHYRYGTETDITTLPWVEYTGSSDITVDNTTAKDYTYRIQVKDLTSVSTVVALTYAAILPVTLDTVIMGNNFGLSGSKIINVTMMSTNTVTDYRMAESTSALEAKAWTAISGTNIAPYTFDSVGDKTLYVQVRNQISVSEVKTGTIRIEDLLPTYMFGFNGTSYDKVDIMQSNGRFYNQARVQINAGYKVSYLADYYLGDVRDHVQYHCSAPYYQATTHFPNNVGGTGSNSNAYMASLVASAPHDLLMMKMNAFPGSTTAGIDYKMRLAFTMKPGTYRLKILTNVNNGTYNESSRLASYFGVFQGANQLAQAQVSDTVGWTGKDNQDFNATMEITITDGTTQVDVGGWCTVGTNKPHISLLEITKLS